MAEQNGATTGRAPDSEVRGAIAAFEQILEIMPNDRASLEAVAMAYVGLGDTQQALEYLLRLGVVMLEEGDAKAAGEALTKLKACGGGDPRATELIAQLSDLVSERQNQVGRVEPSTDAGAGGLDSASRIRYNFSVADELSFAWELMESGDLSQEEYASVAQDLTDMSATESESTVSVLHVLESRGFKSLDRILQRVAKDAGTPMISLSCFDIQGSASSLLPVDFMLRRGVMTFELVGDEALVVVMNPYDKQLKRDVEALSGHRCHFFLALPSDFDAALNRISEVEVEPSSLE